MVNSGGSGIAGGDQRGNRDRLAPDPNRHSDAPIGGLAARERGKGLMRGLIGLVILAAVV